MPTFPDRTTFQHIGSDVKLGMLLSMGKFKPNRLVKAKPIPFKQAELKRMFRYDQRSGKLYWRVSTNNRVKVGDEAGSLEAEGYRVIKINSESYKAHRLIWLMVRGEISENLHIDHKDGVKYNNWMGNLRQVTKSENMFNQKKVKGYYRYRWGNKWVASIRLDGKLTHLGYFTNKKDARAAYLAAKKIYHKINEAA